MIISLAILLQYSPDISLNPKLLSTNPHTFSPNITTILTFLPPSRALFPPGPYFLSASGALYQPLRLYSDVSGAFTQSVTAGPSSTYVALPASIPGIEAVAVGVPSRLYYTKTAAKPLAGVRLGVKDIYDLRGQRTSDGNRAFYALYPPRTANANPVQRLIDAGAIVVGKMKTSQFANGELATADWVDYHAPFNPRADGYQDGSSSSTGAGSGEGSYSWLDLSLGSDTGGSIRGPAQVQGVFGNRPSHGAVELTNTMSLAPQLDTSGFLTRDTSLWLTASKVLYANITFSSALPKKLRALDFPTTAASTEDSILIKFLAQLESFLGVEASPYNLTTSWATTKPDPALPPLTEYLNKTYPTLIAVQQSRNVRNPFFADYAAKYDGRTPFVDPVPTRRWAYGDEVGQPALDRELARKKVFQNWWTGEVLGTKGEGECSDGILVYNVKAKTQYRNIYLE